jgi:hypothetical protein
MFSIVEELASEQSKTISVVGNGESATGKRACHEFDLVVRQLESPLNKPGRVAAAG